MSGPEEEVSRRLIQPESANLSCQSWKIPSGAGSFIGMLPESLVFWVILKAP